MTKPSLSMLYQALTDQQTLSARALVDAETALRAASGRVVPHERGEVAAALAGSSAHADLVKFLHALEPASAELAQGLAGRGAVHERRRRHGDAQGRVAPRSWQWGALAACVVAALALFVVRGGQLPGTVTELRAQLPQAHVSDQIFDGRLELGLARHEPSADRIFDANSAADAVDDRIFAARTGG